MSLPEHAHGHESAIKTPRQLLVTVILAFLIPIAVIILLVNLVGASIRTGAGSDSQSGEAIARRIQPVAGFKLVDADAPKVFKTGEQVFQSTCSACHGTGVAGAPKFGDKDAWAKYIKLGYESLVQNAIHGINAMPPKGGNASLDDFEVARAVVYMTNHSGANFDEPKEPAAGDAAKPETAAAPAAAPQAAMAKPAEAKPAEAKPAAAAQAEAKPAAQADAGNAVGKKLYESVCITCHSIGLAGAPKFGDKASWEPFIKTGLDTMLKNAINGVNAMPPRGGSQASDEELKAAIQYMVDAAK
ncbi:cytochrome c5 family protein [Castellaniella denitrificans]|uniref:C-type cytochrome n=1 Tax=Castellaniella denitrificans TaxID=56119 RepID=A0ABT4LZM9_9BURK|nr:c-type cytochrome [Castellaniella denitrificans]MCZ4328518.1 c-type cytochrome [Castellaniella denitrificans]